jgi:hypothetical protein
LIEVNFINLRSSSFCIPSSTVLAAVISSPNIYRTEEVKSEIASTAGLH